MAERIAVYPGSFDPPTLGHLDLMQRASKLFDRLIVAVLVNTSKAGLFSDAERLDMLREITAELDNVSVDSFTGLTVEYAKNHGAIALVRGLRAVSDFEHELTLATTNRKMLPEVDTLLLMPNQEYMFVSSRLVKEICQLGGDVSPFVPEIVRIHLEKRLRSD